MIDLYHLPITKEATKYSETLLTYVSLQRQKSIAKYRFESDQLLSLYGALLVRLAISQTQGIPWNLLEFSVQKNGKPTLRDHSNCHFNLSHTNGYVLCAIGEFSIGVDIERITKSPPYEIMSRYFHPEESSYVNEKPDSQAQRFYEIWTKKEAILKQSGIGIIDDLAIMNSLEYENCKSWCNEHYAWSVFYTEKRKNRIHYLTIVDILNFFEGRDPASRIPLP